MLAEVYKGGEKPDLVVSGTNMGQNTSLVVNHSGTIADSDRFETSYDESGEAG